MLSKSAVLRLTSESVFRGHFFKMRKLSSQRGTQKCIRDIFRVSTDFSLYYVCDTRVLRIGWGSAYTHLGQVQNIISTTGGDNNNKLYHNVRVIISEDHLYEHRLKRGDIFHYASIQHKLYSIV